MDFATLVRQSAQRFGDSVAVWSGIVRSWLTGAV